MTLYQFNLLSTYSILPCAIIAIVRYGKVINPYKLFFIFIWAALANELLSTFLIKNSLNNAINGNIYVLAEFSILLWLFKKMGSYYLKMVFYNYVAVAMAIIWLTDNIIMHQLSGVNYIFRIASSFVIVCMSINHINHLLVTEKKLALKHAGFIICMGLLVFFMYKVFFEILFAANLPFKLFYEKLYFIFLVMNLFVNLLYTVAAVWTPTRQKFFIPF